VVFIREKFWLENSLSQWEGGRGGVRPGKETGCGGQRPPSGGASSTYVREKRRCVGGRNGSHGTVEIKLLCFRWLSLFFKCVQKGFPGKGQAVFSVNP